MDDATASDLVTDARIQRTIRKLSDTTLLTIAYYLQNAIVIIG